VAKAELEPPRFKGSNLSSGEFSRMNIGAALKD
jgi:hypothetical protein